MQPTQIRLVDYPDGLPGDETWDLTDDPTPELREGQVEVEVQLIPVDPGMKGWISPWRSYIEPVQPGGVMRAFGIGPVTRSASSVYTVGDVVSGFTGVQTTAVVDGRSMRPIDLDLGPIELHMSALGTDVGCQASRAARPAVSAAWASATESWRWRRR